MKIIPEARRAANVLHPVIIIMAEQSARRLQAARHLTAYPLWQNVLSAQASEVLNWMPMHERVNVLAVMLATSRGTHSLVSGCRFCDLEWQRHDSAPPREAAVLRALDFLSRHSRRQHVNMPNCLILREDILLFSRLPGLSSLRCMGTLLRAEDVADLWACAGTALRDVRLSHCSPALTRANLRRLLPPRALNAVLATHIEESTVDDVWQLQCAAANGQSKFLALRLDAVNEPSGFMRDFCFVFGNTAAQNGASLCVAPETPAGSNDDYCSDAVSKIRSSTDESAHKGVLTREKKRVHAEHAAGSAAASALHLAQRGADIAREARELFGENLAVVRVQLNKRRLHWREVGAKCLPERAQKRPRTGRVSFA